MSACRRLLLLAAAVVALGVLAILARPGWHLFQTWRAETAFAARPVPTLPAGTLGDASQVETAPMESVVPSGEGRAAREETLRSLLVRARREGRQVTVAGARHSMGGHTLYPGGLSLDLREFRELSLDTGPRVLRAGAGARWADIIPYLDQQGFSVTIMQSNDDFSVGGSISVNCHGWQHDAPPIASSVESLRVMLADGSVVVCSRSENHELFRLVLGGYGLFGIILDADLRVVPNETYRPIRRTFPLREYVSMYREMTRANAGMAFGRISVAPASFLNEAAITGFVRDSSAGAAIPAVRSDPPSTLKRLIFRGSVGNDYGKNLRWKLERWFGDSGDRGISRNQIQFQPAGWFENRNPATTDILHEYFLPEQGLIAFVERIAPILRAERADLLNITVRNVRADPDSFLHYAGGEVFGLVMLFHQSRDAAGDAAMGRLTRKLVDVALECGGRYYLPYRGHATRDQFQRAYPQGAEFFDLKKKYDPELLFQNAFYRAYRPAPY